MTTVLLLALPNDWENLSPSMAAGNLAVTGHPESIWQIASRRHHHELIQLVYLSRTQVKFNKSNGRRTNRRPEGWEIVLIRWTRRNKRPSSARSSDLYK